MSGEKEVLRQAEEILKIEDKANEISQKLLVLRVELADIYHEVEKLEKEYERYAHVRHTEEEFKELRKKLLEKYRKIYEDLIEFDELVFKLFF